MPSHTEAQALPATYHNSSLIVILGMHRSGTSALTRAMGVLGADFGDNLMPPAEGVNDKGFFEDLDINAINIAVMHAAGADWDTMAPIDIDAIEPQCLDRLQTDAIATLRQKCKGKIFALKDPRIARLLPFWQPVFTRLETRVKYVIAFRNPISVTKSLAHRNQFPEEKSYLLWLAHTVPALQKTRTATRALIDYDHLMDNPRRELSRVATELDLPLVEASLAEFEQEFLDSDLRHSHFAPPDLELVRSAPRQVKALYRALNDAASTMDHDAQKIDAIIDEGSRYLEDTAPLLRNAWRLEQEIRRLDAAAVERDAQIHQLTEQLARCNKEVESLRHQSRALIDEAHGDIDRSLAELHSSQQLIGSLRATVSDQQDQLARAGEEMATVLASTSWRISAPLRALKRLVT